VLHIGPYCDIKEISHNACQITDPTPWVRPVIRSLPFFTRILMANPSTASSTVRKRNSTKSAASLAPRLGVSRLHVTLPDSLQTRLGEIASAAHATSTAEVFRNALTVYAALLDAHQAGKHVLIQNPDGTDRERLRLFI
jgi:hypothetical protein